MKVRKYILGIKIGIILVLTAVTGYYVYDEYGNRNTDSELVAEYQQSKEVTQVIPAGIMTGIYAETKGVLALGVGNISTPSGDVNSPAEGIIEKGDYIIACEGKGLESKEELVEIVRSSEGKELNLEIARGDKVLEVNVTPISDGKQYCLGVWVRDDIAGIGMLTYVTSDMKFGALGHCISDMDLGIEMDIRTGTLHKAELTDIVKGKEGEPGQLIGYISYHASNPEGYLYKNDDTGIGGELFELPNVLEKVAYVSVGKAEELKEGDALLICDISGEREAYEIEIDKKYGIFTSGNKNFTIKVTDERLLALTGGIVQGMSGAPIIQDGKLVGAVTHVLVNDPTRGYGIYIENMLEW